MEKATSSLRRGGAFLFSIGSGYQELNLITSELKNLRSHIKAVRNSQQTVLQDMTNWACSEENRALQELFVHLMDLNSLWSEVQTQFADQINDFKHQFEMILEGEKVIDSARNKFSHCEQQEQKARKELKKSQKKRSAEDVRVLESKVVECERQKEFAQADVSEKIKENEAVKLIRIKDGLLKLSEAYLTLSRKCIYIFEAQKDVTQCLPDVEDKEIQEIRYDGLSGAKEALTRAQNLVKQYPSNTNTYTSPSQNRSTDPPPPYSPGLYTPNPSFNPYYANVEGAHPPGFTLAVLPDNRTPNQSRTDEELAHAVNAAKI